MGLYRLMSCRNFCIFHREPVALMSHMLFAVLRHLLYAACCCPACRQGPYQPITSARLVGYGEDVKDVGLLGSKSVRYEVIVQCGKKSWTVSPLPTVCVVVVP